MTFFDDFINSLPEPKVAPSQNWQPPFSGDMDMLIKQDGSWWHEGSAIVRDSLTALFASILRYEDEFGYVLVSPVEKWRITVEDVPFVAELLEQKDGELHFATKFAGVLTLGDNHPMSLKPFQGELVPYILVRDNLYARVSRNVYYELAELCEEHEGVLGVWSAGRFWPMQ